MSKRIDLAAYVARRVEVRPNGSLVEVVYSENMNGVQAVLKDVATIKLTRDQARELARSILLFADAEDAA